VFPGQEIEYLIVSPTTGEIFFVDDMYRIFSGYAEEVGCFTVFFLMDEDMERVELALNATTFGEDTGVRIAEDTYGNLFHMVEPYNEFILNSFFLAQHGTIVRLDGEYVETPETHTVLSETAENQNSEEHIHNGGVSWLALGVVSTLVFIAVMLALLRKRKLNI